MKYIDAEKLLAEIEGRRLSNRYINTEDYENELLEIINSLQQEQQGVDFETEGIITNAGGQFGYDVATFGLNNSHAFTVLIPHDDNAKHGDKVKLIVIKEK